MNPLELLRPVSIKEKVRLGPKMDGGYVVYNRILKDTTVLLTYGVGWEIGFEQHFAEQTGNKVLMFDPTMFGKYLINFDFLLRLLSKRKIRESSEYLQNVWTTWKSIKQLREQNITFVNEGVAVKKANKFDTFGNHLKRYSLLNEQILLKMDVEGDEFGIFEDPDIYQHLRHVNQIIIEFHDLCNLFPRFQNIIKNLLTDYEIIHIHGNNWGGEFCFDDPVEGKTIVVPNVLEVSFVRRSEIAPDDIINERLPFPTEGLDYPNNPDYSDLALRFI